MLKDLDEKGIAIKTIFDGYDFLQHDVGKILIPDAFRYKVIASTYVDTLYEGSDEFLYYCSNNIKRYNLDTYVPNNLVHKYKLGLYSLKDCLDNKNPWKDKNYILFNSRMIKPLINKFEFLEQALFWVCPAFDTNGKCEAIGFRIVDKNTVLNSFKWLFTCGNNIIYGKNTVNKNSTCYVVEGFRDYIALNELGYNVIGLGSVVISKSQEEYLDTLNDVMLLLDNDNFGLQKTIQYKDKYKVATLVGSKEKDAYDTWIKNGKIDIREIK